MSIKNFAKKAAFTFLTIGAGLGLYGSDEVKAQSTRDLEQTMAGDTLTASGIFTAVNTVNGNTISDVTIKAYATAMSMVIDPTVHQETTDNNGAAPFQKYSVYIDSTVDINEFIKKSTQIVPTIGSEINAFFDGMQTGTIELYDIRGRLVEKQKFNSDHVYVDLSRLATGMHIYKIKTEQGEFSDKFMKIGYEVNGPTQRPSPKADNFKDTKYLEEATYTVVWEKEGFIIKDSASIILQEGNNGFINLYMQPVAGIPQHQDFTGTVRDGSNNNVPIANTLVTLEDVVSGDTLWMFTGSDGKFSFNNLNLGQEYILNVGNVTGKQSHEGSYCSTPIEITVASDTAINLTDVFLLDLDGLTPQHIKDHTSNGSQQGVIQYFLGDSFNEAQKTSIRNYFTQFQSDEDNIHIFAESSIQLNNTGINIEHGTYNTQTNKEAIITPFGTLYRVLFATSTMGTGNYNGFVHEIKRALGIDEVSWQSVMKTPAIVYHQEDKDIGMFEGKYWENMYNGMTNLDLNTITDSIPIPAGARAYKKNGSKGEFNNYNKNLPTSKYMNN